MSESGFWRKGVAVALIVLMLFVAAAMLTPAADAVVAHYTYDPDRHPPNPDRLELDIGETSETFDITIGIDWGGEPTRPVETEMNWSCVCNGVDATGSMGFDFQPSTFTLDAGNGYLQIVTVRVTSLGGATEPKVTCKVEAWEVIVGDPPVGQGTGCHVYLLTTVGPPPNGNGCFIATAAYGTSTAEEIDILRAFRDEVMLESTVGSQLVEWYYQTSPQVADFISENSLLRTIVRELVIDPMVSLAKFTQGIWGD